MGQGYTLVDEDEGSCPPGQVNRAGRDKLVLTKTGSR